MTEKRGFSSLLDSRSRIDVEPLSHLLAELYPSKLAPSLPTPDPAYNPPDPFYGLGRQGRGVVSKTVHETVHAQRQAQRAGRETPLLPATGCEQPQSATKNADDPKSKESHALDALMPHDATGCEERRRRDSNPGWRICNPLP